MQLQTEKQKARRKGIVRFFGALLILIALYFIFFLLSVIGWSS